MSYTVLEPSEYDKTELEIIECGCGFHLGLDASYLLQVDGIDIECPSCGQVLSVCTAAE